MDVDQTFSKLLCRLCTFTLCPWFMSQSLPITLNPWSKYAIFSQNVPESGRYWRPHCQEGSWWMLTKPFPNSFDGYIFSYYTLISCLEHCPSPLIHVPNIPFFNWMFLDQEDIDVIMMILGHWAVCWVKKNVRLEFSIQNYIMSPNFINIHHITKIRNLQRVPPLVLSDVSRRGKAP